MSYVVKKPVRDGIAKVPVIMQMEALECGAACLCMVLAYFDKWVPLEKAREDCGVSRDGSKAGNILKAARHYGLTAAGYRYKTDSLKEKGTFPCIIYWNYNHYVVLKGFKRGKAYINDPSKGEYSLPLEMFERSYTGICMLFEPGEQFEPGGSKKSIYAFVKKRMEGTGPAAAFTAATAVIAAAMSFISPAFSRVFLDNLLSGTDTEWAGPFLVILAVFDVVQLLMSTLESVYSLRLNGKMAAGGNACYMWKILKLPMRFYSQRMAGDIQSRQQTNAGIANSLINTFAPMLLNMFMMVFYLVIMLRYSVLLTIVGIISLIINSAVSGYISKKNINISRVSSRCSARLSSASVEGIDMIETIKASGAEDGFFEKWAGYQAEVNTQKVQYLKLNSYLGMIPQAVSEIADKMILFLGVFLVMQGKFTVGMIMTFQGFLQSFMAPAGGLVSVNRTIQEMRTDMERVEDVMEYPDDDVFSQEQNADMKKLTGMVELKNVTFGYAPLAQPFVKDFSMTVMPGQSVAIVGASGSGKSTMSKLISGLYKAWSGEILFDGKPISSIDKDVFRGSVAVVDQDIIIFHDTIADNIKMWDDSIKDFEMILAADDAKLHDDIMKRPGGYRYVLSEGGKDFSGGQRQRLEIARALAQEPSIIILDEATSALDAQTEYEVANNIRNRGITTIIIAHRLSTIRSCDEIIVMEQGEIKGRGTHKELMENCSIYKELITAE